MEKFVNKITQKYYFKERRHQMYEWTTTKIEKRDTVGGKMHHAMREDAGFLHSSLHNFRCQRFQRRQSRSLLREKILCVQNLLSFKAYSSFFAMPFLKKNQREAAVSTMKAARNDEKTIRVIEAKIIFYSSSKQQFSLKNSELKTKEKNAFFQCDRWNEAHSACFF